MLTLAHKRHLLLAVSLLLAIAASAVHWQIQRTTGQLRDLASVELLNSSMKLENELRGFESSLWRALSTGDVATVRLAYDIAWNRFDILSRSAALNRQLSALDRYQDLEALVARFTGLEPDVAALQDVRPAAIAAMAQEVGALRTAANVFGGEMLQLIMELTAASRRSLEHLNALFAAITIAIGLCLGTLTWLLVRNIRALDGANAELSRMSGDLEAALRRSQAANMAKDDFLAVMSHELRTPLNAIIGFSEFMTMSGSEMPAPRRQEYLEHILSSGRMLHQLVSQILQFSKLESGTSLLEEEAVPLETLLREQLEIAAASQGRRRDTFTVSVPVPTPQLWADARALRQMMLNLIVNACKFSPHGSRIETSVLPGPSGGLGIRIADQGPGMTESEVAVALEPFGQVASAQVRGQGGVGLGLPITRQLVELHGGRLDIDTAPGAGCRMTLWFPPERTMAAVPDEAVA